LSEELRLTYTRCCCWDDNDAGARRAEKRKLNADWARGAHFKSSRAPVYASWRTARIYATATPPARLICMQVQHGTSSHAIALSSSRSCALLRLETLHVGSEDDVEECFLHPPCLPCHSAPGKPCEGVHRLLPILFATCRESRTCGGRIVLILSLCVGVSHSLQVA
jgi:hypothetical protein